MLLRRLSNSLAIALSCVLALAACGHTQEEAQQPLDARPPSQAGEYRRPFDAASDRYYRMLLAERFDDLDREIEKASSENSVLSDGQPLAAAIYGGVAGCLSSGCRERLSKREWEQRGALIRKWKALRPGSVAAEISAASFHVQYGWMLRGAGPVDTVKDGALDEFANEMSIAERDLQAVGARAKEEPEWAAAFLDVGVARHWPRLQFDAVFHEAVRKHPYALMVYFAGCTYYAPRWYGSPDELRQCAEEAASATQAKLGDTMYARINWALRSEEMFDDGQAEWPRMRAGFERIVADYPDPWNINKFAMFACQNEDGPTTAKLSRQIGDKPIVMAWNGDERLYRHCVYAAQQATRAP